MINGFEFDRIKKSQLPTAWQEDGALEDLQEFLQRNWQQRKIFYTDGFHTSNQQFIDFDRKDAIKLQNYVGTIVFRGEQLNIFPKVFKEDEDDHDTSNLSITDLLRNLLYWLQYCDRLNFPFIQFKTDISEATSLIELFITVYVHYVKTTIEKHRFHRYEDVCETGSFAKGKIDFYDYAVRKLPYGRNEKLDYTYSSFVFDNTVNRIIKCTCRQIFNITEQPANKKAIHKILAMLADVSDKNCMPYECDTVKLSSLHSSYRVILSMSKMFLMNKTSNASMGPEDNFCFLFPAEVLFESFIGGFMKDMLSSKAQITTQASDQYLAELIVDGETVGNTFLLKEDILIEFLDYIVVLDTKYKEIDRFNRILENKKLGISDSDMKQMAIYAAKRGAKKLFLIYPLHVNEAPETIEVVYKIHLSDNGSTIDIPLEILKVPFAFRESEEKTSALLRDILQKVAQ